MRYFIVNAFTDKLFSGNPAGVCILDHWLDEKIMQRIAHENGLSETAFVCAPPRSEQNASQHNTSYEIRWFTPKVEVDLCGHATLASTFVLATFLDTASAQFCFNSRSGQLTVERAGDLFALNFPTRQQTQIPVTEAMSQAVGETVLSAYSGHKLMLELENECSVRNVRPDFEKIGALSSEGVVVTAKGDSVDFVSRYFAPLRGVNEDPVTGVTHTTLIPYWSERLHKTDLVAQQLSERGGTLWCKNAGERVIIAGKASLYLSGELHVGSVSQ